MYNKATNVCATNVYKNFTPLVSMIKSLINEKLVSQVVKTDVVFNVSQDQEGSLFVNVIYSDRF